MPFIILLSGVTLSFFCSFGHRVQLDSVWAGTIQGSESQESRILEVTLEAVCDSCVVIESFKGSKFYWWSAKSSAEIFSSAASWQQAIIPSKLTCR